MNWNPSFPEVLGLEWLTTHGFKDRVWGGAPARAQRLISTTAEEISALKLSAEVNTLSKASVPTVIDVVEEGDEFVPLFKRTVLVPNSDVSIDDWTTGGGATSNLYMSINESTDRWPGPASDDGHQIQVTSGLQEYACTVDASLFDTGGDAENGRIGFVSVKAIMGANTGFRKLAVHLRINDVLYSPAAGSLRDVHWFGGIYVCWWGELNPATNLPWTPADIADFDTGGDSEIVIKSYHAATAAHYPIVHALGLEVHYAEVENRAAVGVWRRPEEMGTERLQNITTDALVEMPAGTADWSKPASGNFLFYWRQSVSPALYGATVADDVRWNGAFQDLGAGGLPKGRVFPLETTGTTPAPDDALCSDQITHDQFGRPQNAFNPRGQSAHGIVLVRDTDGEPSVDSQPYRLDLSDLGALDINTSYGQRITPSGSHSYLGVRLPVIPPLATNLSAILTVTIHRVSDNVQMGGSFSITAAACRALKAGPNNVRYVTGFLSSGASLVSGTAYEIRLTTNNQHDWIVFVPDASLGPEASFNGTAGDGAYIDGVHTPDRDLVVNLIRQPDPPGSPTASIFTNQVTMPDQSVRDVEHVSIEWLAPAISMASLFSHYELERSLVDSPTEADWVRVANINDEAVLEFPDHLVPRETEATYRIRAVGTDGRISAWATTSGITPAQGDYDVLLTSNHSPELEFVMDADPEADYRVLSNDKNEIVALYGVDYQVVFTETEDRGVGWKTGVELNFGTEPPVILSGQKLLTPLLAIVQSPDIPYVAAMDFQGTRILGHVTVSDASQSQPGNVYKAAIDVIPTHTEEVPVEVDSA